MIPPQRHTAGYYTASSFTRGHIKDKDDKKKKRDMQVKTHNALDFYFILWQFKRILVFPMCVCWVFEGSTKTKLMNQLGHWNGHWDCGTDKEKLQVALFSTKLFTEESDFLHIFFFFLKVFFFFFPKWRHPITCGSLAFQPSGEFLKVEKTVDFFFFN